MKKAVITLVLVLGCVVFGKAQSSINDYKYVVVPHFYEFVKGKDAYRLNTITRYLLRKKGLTAFMEEEISASDYKNNSCLALRADVVNIKSMLKTKLKVVLTNCDGEVIFESAIGESKSKAYEIAYRAALNQAFESFENINYAYVPNEDILSRKVENEDAVKAEKEVKKLKAELEELKEKKAKVEQEETLKTQVSDVVKVENTKSYLKANPITNGFELINSITDKVEYVIHTAKIPNVFMIKDYKGIIYKKDDQWLIEYVEGDKTITKTLDIRF